VAAELVAFHFFAEFAHGALLANHRWQLALRLFELHGSACRAKVVALEHVHAL
jgi:hypothetical protein